MVGLLELLDELEHFLWVALYFVTSGMLVEEVKELTLAALFTLIDLVSLTLIDNAVLWGFQDAH